MMQTYIRSMIFATLEKSVIPINGASFTCKMDKLSSNEIN